jgi:hypothetical protein
VRWLQRLLRHPDADDEMREIEQKRQQTEDDWKKVRETSQDLADLITDALKGDEGGASRRSH